VQNIEEVYKEYSNAVYKYVFCLTENKELAEEITQETFAIAVKEIKKFQGNCKVSTWLCQIAKHLWYKELKKKKQISFEEMSHLPEEKTIEEIVLEREEKLKFFKDIHKLDAQSKEIIYLRMVGNLDFKEIGEILGKTPNWARVQFYRAKQKMKEENKDGEKNGM